MVGRRIHVCRCHRVVVCASNEEAEVNAPSTAGIRSGSHGPTYRKSVAFPGLRYTKAQNPFGRSMADRLEREKRGGKTFSKRVRLRSPRALSTQGMSANSFRAGWLPWGATRAAGGDRGDNDGIGMGVQEPQRHVGSSDALG